MRWKSEGDGLETEDRGRETGDGEHELPVSGLQPLVSCRICSRAFARVAELARSDPKKKAMFSRLNASPP